MGIRVLNVKVFLIAFVGLILSGATRAADLSAVAGHYRYEQYAVTLPNGRVLQLKDLGASEAFLDISQTEITLRMTLARGDTVPQSAKILGGNFAKGAGYWKAKGPDLKGPGRGNITFVGGGS